MNGVDGDKCKQFTQFRVNNSYPLHYTEISENISGYNLFLLQSSSDNCQLNFDHMWE